MCSLFCNRVGVNWTDGRAEAFSDFPPWIPLLHNEIAFRSPRLLTVDISEEAVSTIELNLEQLQRKQTILEELDAKIAPLITEETELEEEIMETEDTRTKILHDVAHLKVKLNSLHTESTEPAPVLNTVQRTQLSTTDGTLLMHSPPVVSNTSDSCTLHTVSITTSHTSPTIEAAASVPISNEAVTLPSEHATVVSTRGVPIWVFGMYRYLILMP